MMYVLFNSRIVTIHVGSNFCGDEKSLSARKLVGEGYLNLLAKQIILTGYTSLISPEENNFAYRLTFIGLND